MYLSMLSEKVTIALVWEGSPLCKEAEDQQVAVYPHLWEESSLFMKSPRSGWKQHKTVSLLCGKWKFINHFLFFFTQLWSVGEVPPLRVLVFWGDMALPVHRSSVPLPFPRADFAKSCQRPLGCLCQSRPR